MHDWSFPSRCSYRKACSSRTWHWDETFVIMELTASDIPSDFGKTALLIHPYDCVFMTNRRCIVETRYREVASEHRQRKVHFKHRWIYSFRLLLLRRTATLLGLRYSLKVSVDSARHEQVEYDRHRYMEATYVFTIKYWIDAYWHWLLYRTSRISRSARGKNTFFPSDALAKIKHTSLSAAETDQSFFFLSLS